MCSRDAGIMRGGVYGYHVILIDIFIFVKIRVMVALFIGVHDTGHGGLIAVACGMLTRCTFEGLAAALDSVRVLRGHCARLRAVVTSPRLLLLGSALFGHGRRVRGQLSYRNRKEATMADDMIRI